MKEFILVEFLFTTQEYVTQMLKLAELGDDFKIINSENEFEINTDGTTHIEEYMRVSGKINAMTATMIKIKNPVLAEKMRISYISDELKDRYRR